MDKSIDRDKSQSGQSSKWGSPDTKENQSSRSTSSQEGNRVFTEPDNPPAERSGRDALKKTSRQETGGPGKPTA